MSCDDAEITANITFISTHFSLLFLLYFNATHFSETYPRVQINVLSKPRLNFFGPTGFFRGSLTSKCFFLIRFGNEPVYFLVESVFPFFRWKSDWVIGRFWNESFLIWRRETLIFDRKRWNYRKEKGWIIYFSLRRTEVF